MHQQGFQLPSFNSGTVLQEVHPPGGGGAGGEGQHADARRDRLLVERGRLETVHHCARVEPQHRRHPCVQQQGSVHKQVHHQHRYASICDVQEVGRDVQEVGHSRNHVP